MIIRSLKPILRLYRFAGRRWWLHGSRLHIELSLVRKPDIKRYHQRIRDELSAMPEVEAVMVVPHMYRVVLRSSTLELPVQALVRRVDEISQQFRMATDVLPDSRFDHPADHEAEDRVEAELVADFLSFGLGLALRAVGRNPNHIEADLTRMITLFDNTPRLKSVLSKRLGYTASDVTLGLASSLAQGVSGGPSSPLIDFFVQRSRLREVRSQRNLWWRSEPRFFSDEEFQQASSSLGMLRPDRAVPLSEGAVESYAEDAWHTSLGGFAVGIADTGRLSASMAPLMAAIPKPALIAREVFAARVATVLAERGTVLLNPRRLRRMDRIDALVLDQRLLDTERLLMGPVRIIGDTRREDVRKALRLLYNPEDPTAVQRKSAWTLQPVEEVTRQLSPTVRRCIKTLQADNTVVLVLSRKQRTCAVIQLRPTPSLAARALVRTAREVGLGIYIVSDQPTSVKLFQPDDIWPLADAVEELRDLQREGHAVFCCAKGDSIYLPHGDLSLLLAKDDGPVNRPVDLVGWNGLEDAAFMVQCCGLARKISRQGVQLTGMGAAIAAGNISRGLKQADHGHISTAVNLSAGISLINATTASRKLRVPVDVAEEAEISWHAMPHARVLQEVESRKQGLTEAEAAGRIVPQAESQSKASLLFAAVQQEIANPLTPLLAAGAGISASVGSVTDAAIVGGVIGFSGLFGGWQRFQAEQAIQALQAAEKSATTVLRDGEPVSVPVGEVVRGDIMRVRAGDLIAADARILEAEYAEVDESSLTGESLPAEKSPLRSFSAEIGERHSMLYAGTAMAGGEATAVVVATGAETEVARSARASSVNGRATGVDARLEELMQLTIPTAVTSSALLMGAGLLRGVRVQKLIEASVNLAVASVPEGLPLLASSAELASAKRLSRRGVLVRNPKAMEALGRMDTLCLDKTGTLTTGKLAFSGVVLAGDLMQVIAGNDARQEEENDLQGMMIPSDAMAQGLPVAARELVQYARYATPEGRDPEDFTHRTDYAIAAAAHSFGVDRTTERVVDELPFRAARMYQAVLVQPPDSKRQIVCIKGAPEEIIGRSSRIPGGRLTRNVRQALCEQVTQLASEGVRVIAVAEGHAPEGELNDASVTRLKILGFLCLRDPLRHDSVNTLRLLAAAGVKPLMLTGDHASTARRIARDLWLGDKETVLTGTEIDAMDDHALAERLASTSVVARAAPAHKLRLVRVLQSKGRVVGMTGDGGNDAPAIRLADVGIALGSHATQAARDASDLLVTDASLESILSAIAEGRGLWGSVRDATSLLVGGNLGEIGFMTAGGLVAGTPPLNSRQLMLLNLFTDVAPALTIALSLPKGRGEEDFLKEGPETSLGQQLSEDIAWRGLVTGSSAGAAWLLSRGINADERTMSTVGLVSLVGTQLGQTLATGGVRDLKLLAASGLSAAGLLGIVMTPGLSGLFGCRPIGPVNLGLALGASVAGTLMGSALPRKRRRTLLTFPRHLRALAGQWVDKVIEDSQDEELQLVDSELSEPRVRRAGYPRERGDSQLFPPGHN